MSSIYHASLVENESSAIGSYADEEPASFELKNLADGSVTQFFCEGPTPTAASTSGGYGQPFFTANRAGWLPWAANFSGAAVSWIYFFKLTIIVVLNYYLIESVDSGDTDDSLILRNHVLRIPLQVHYHRRYWSAFHRQKIPASS
ncbi:hypothetical protein OROMI_000966 [Orobanche minor]